MSELKKGRYPFRRKTGKSVARVVMKCILDEANGLTPEMNEEERQKYVQTSLAGKAAQIDEYNAWMAAARNMDFTKSEARIMALEAERQLMRNNEALSDYFAAYRIRIAQQSMPEIMTQQQADTYLSNLKQKQKEYILETLIDLSTVVVGRAWELAEQDIKEMVTTNPQWRDDATFPGGEWYLLRRLDEGTAKRLNMQARAEIRELIDSLTINIELDNNVPDEIANCDLQEILADYFDGAELEGRTRTVVVNTQILTKELYEAKLPEWIRWVDNYKPQPNEDFPHGRPVAIVQNPSSDQINEKGEYQGEKVWKRLLWHYSKLESSPLKDQLMYANQQIKEKIKDFLARKTVLDVFSQAIEVDLSSEAQAWLDEVKFQVQRYNFELKRNESLSSGRKRRTKQGERANSMLPADLHLPELDIDSLQPTQEELDYIKDRLSMHLGEAWWDEAVAHLSGNREVSDK